MSGQQPGRYQRGGFEVGAGVGVPAEVPTERIEFLGASDGEPLEFDDWPVAVGHVGHWNRPEEPCASDADRSGLVGQRDGRKALGDDQTIAEGVAVQQREEGREFVVAAQCWGAQFAVRVVLPWPQCDAVRVGRVRLSEGQPDRRRLN